MPGRVLIVAPHFAPVNAPDGHRARLILPYLAGAGWTAAVLAVRPEYVRAPLEPALESTLPRGTPIHRVHAITTRSGGRFGLGNLGWRCLPWLWREGSRLLGSGAFDVVYFSTTQFACLPLGRWWRQRFGVPYVIDLQDPWHNVYYARDPAAPRPGGWKYRFAALSTRAQEGWTLRRCSHVISVSPRYIDDLCARRPWFNAARATVLPFGWSKVDQEAARGRTPSASPGDGEILYVGRVGEDMARLLHLLLSAFAGWLRARPAAAPLVRWNFLGTSYAANTTAGGTVTRLARALGLGDVVSENHARMPYLDALARQQRSAANLLLGSDDLAYSPSKLWPALATGRPWLGCAWNGSVFAEHLTHHSGSGLLATASAGRFAPAQITSLHAWFDAVAQGTARLAPPSPALAEWHADRLARAHAAIFDTVTS